MLFRQMDEGAQVLGEAVASVAIPASRNWVPMRESRPMPRVTAVTSAPTLSHKSETMLMNDIFVERKALAACLMSSAVLVSVTTRAFLRGYKGWSGYRAPARNPPRTRFGRDGRNPPEPCLRAGIRDWRRCRNPRMRGRKHRRGLNCRPGVLHGAVAYNRALQPLCGYGRTVLFSTISCSRSGCGPPPRHGFHLPEVGLALAFWGVPTQMKMMEPSRTAASHHRRAETGRFGGVSPTGRKAGFEENRITRPDATTLLASWSAPITRRPNSAKPSAVGSPIWPSPGP